jgi:hypothetical protein
MARLGRPDLKAGRPMQRVLLGIAALLAAAAGCAMPAHDDAANGDRSASSPASRLRDPHTASALLRVARVFNDEYGRGDYGPVYDRWDARSQAIITKSEYVRRHAECPTAPQPGAAHVESASKGPRAAWLVRYEIGGYQLTDYWFYVHDRWVFDLVLSNPDSVRLYRLPARRYLAAEGCTH